MEGRVPTDVLLQLQALARVIEDLPHPLHVGSRRVLGGHRRDLRLEVPAHLHEVAGQDAGVQLAGGPVPGRMQPDEAASRASGSLDRRAV